MTIEQRLISAGFTKDSSGVWARGELGLSEYMVLQLSREEVDNLLEIAERRKNSMTIGSERRKEQTEKIK